MNMWQDEIEREERRDRCAALQEGGDTAASRFGVPSDAEVTAELDRRKTALLPPSAARALQRRADELALTDDGKDALLRKWGALSIPHFIEQPCVRCGCRRRYAAMPYRCLFCEASN